MPFSRGLFFGRLHRVICSPSWVFCPLCQKLRAVEGCVAFVERGEVCRVISLRRANRREVKHYVESI